MIDMKELAGKRYRTSLDESAESDGSHAEAPWYRRIPCRRGHICVHGPETLGAWTDRRGIFARLLAIPDVAIHQRGDREISVTFPPGRLDLVAEVLQARKRRQISDAERARLASIGRLPTVRAGKSTLETHAGG